MKFELSPELIDLIIFAMEDQEHEYLFDVENEVLILTEEVSEEDLEEGEDRYISLPEWRPVDGFNLMERFTASLRNPLYRERLRQILSSGRGVFRQFKNTVKERVEIEKLWLRFKQGEMKKEVYRWYNSLRETWGLKEIEIEGEEPEDLVLSDFSIHRWEAPEDSTILPLDRIGFFEMVDSLCLSQPEKEGLYQSKRRNTLPSGPDSIVYRAFTPANELAAFLWAVREPDRMDGNGCHILQFYCKPEFRGLGLGKSILEQFCSQIFREGDTRVTVELLGASLELAESLKNYGFNPVSVVLEIEGSVWKREHGLGA